MSYRSCAVHPIQSARIGLGLAAVLSLIGCTTVGPDFKQPAPPGAAGYTANALPFLGEVRPGVWAAGGYCGTGNVIGALCARQLVSNVLDSGPTYWS